MALFSHLIATTFREYLRKNGRSILIVTMVLAILIVLLKILGNYTSYLVGSILQNVVQTETNGKYTASFSEVRYYVNNGKFRVGDFSLRPTEMLLNDLPPCDSPSNTTVYEIYVADIYLNPGNLLHLYFNKELRIRDIELNEPRADITQYGYLTEIDTAATLSKKIENLYDAITSSLRVFEINNFELTNGHFQFINHRGTAIARYRMNDVSFRIENFLLAKDQEDYRPNFYYTDNVEIGIRSQELLLSDSLHKLSFDRLLLSTITKEIILQNFSISQRMHAPAISKPEHVSSRLNISLPEVRMEGVDFVRMYKESRLAMRNIRITDPVLKTYIAIPAQKERNAQKEEDSFELEDFLKKLDVASIQMENAMLDMYIALAHGTYQYSGKINTLHSSNIQVTPGRPAKDVFGYGTFVFKSEETKVKVPQYDGTFEWKSIEAVGNHGPIDVTISGLRTNTKAQSPSVVQKGVHLLRSDVSEISIRGLRPEQFLGSDTVRISALTMDQPQLDLLLSQGEKNLKNVQSTTGEAGAGKTLILDRLSITDGSLTLQEMRGSNQEERGQIRNYTLDIGRVALNRQLARAQDLPFLNRMQCSAEGIEVALPGEQKLLLKNFDIDTQTEQLNLSELQILDEKTGTPKFFQKLQRSASIRSVDISGFDLAQIVQGSPIDIQTVDISSGGIEYNISVPKFPGSDPQAKPSLFSSVPQLRIASLRSGELFIDLKKEGRPLLSIRSLHFEAGDLQHKPETGTTLLPNISVARGKISASRYVVYLNNLRHILSGEQLAFDMDGALVRLTNTSLMPQEAGKGDPVYHISVPRCTIGGIDFQKLHDETVFSCTTISIDQPQMRLHRVGSAATPGKTTQSRQARRTLGPLPLQAVQVGRLTVRGAALLHEMTVQGKKEEFTARELGLDVYNIELDSTTGNRILYYADSVNAAIRYLTYENTRRKEFVRINHLDLQSGKGKIRVEGLYASNNTDLPPHTDAFLIADVGALQINNIDVEGLLKNKTVQARAIHLARPQIRMQTVHDPAQDKRSYPKGIHHALDSAMVHTIRLDTFLLRNASLDARIGTARGFQHVGVRSLDISGATVHINAHDTLHADTKVAGKLDIDVKGLSSTGADGLNTIRVSQIVGSLQRADLYLNDLEVRPNVDKYEFGPNKGFQTDWVLIKNPEIRFEKLDFDKLLSGRGLHAARIVLQKPSIVLFRDKRLPFPEDQRKNMPQHDLRRLHFPLHIHELNLVEGFVSYLEHGVKSNAPGEVFFSSLNGTVSNITNDRQALLTDHTMQLEASGLLMGTGRLEANVTFDLTDGDDGFVLGASVQPFALSDLNRMLSPNVFIEISSGYNERLLMNVKGNNEYAMGEMDFFYSDLKIALLNKETETPVGVGNALGSFFANTFVIHSNNPRKLTFRKGEIFFERDIRKSIFSFWSKSFLSGVVTSIGAKSNHKNIHEIHLKQQEKYKDQISQKSE